MDKEFYAEEAKREEERRKRFEEYGNQFNNLMLQFHKLNDESVDYVCSLLRTPSVAKVYSLFMERPHFLTFDDIWTKSHLHRKTVRKALKRLAWYGVIYHLDYEPETWALVLKNWSDFR